MIRETFVDYTPKKRSWLYQRLFGQYKNLMAVKRAVKWKLYLLLNPVTINKHKLLKGSMPVLINNHNRLSSLQAQIRWLLYLDADISIIVVDNNSNYLPLLNYYLRLALVRNCQIIYLKHNSWLKGINLIASRLTEFSKLIMTDSDLVPYHNTPGDIIDHLSKLLDTHSGYNHIGLSLELNDIPDYYPLKPIVLQHESQFWPPIAVALDDEVIVAPVHSTFAMYRSNSVFNSIQPALRTTRPYTLKHADWYIDSGNISAEYKHYLKYCQPVASWSQELMAVRKNQKN
jgi:hypothetical protein